MTPKHLFIVGLPRTGTKLVQNVLTNTPDIDFRSSGETFFIGRLLRPGVKDELKQFGDRSRDENIRRLVEHLYSGRVNGGYWDRLKSGQLQVPQEAFLQAILKSDRSDQAIYRIILAIHTTLNDRTMLADKTPSHLYHVPTLLDWFPEAKVIHTFRDPRAILASEWRKRTLKTPADYLLVASDHFLYSPMIVLHITFSWLYAVRLHKQYQKRFPRNYYLSKFEDLVQKPEQSVPALCDFLEIDFYPEMLSPRRSDSSYEERAASGFDQEALLRWNDHLRPWMKLWMSVWTARYLKEFDYV